MQKPLFERTLLRGYADLMSWLHSPKAYYDRCKAYLNRAGSISETGSSTLSEVGALLRTIWHVGVLSRRRRLFWQLMVKAMLRGRSQIRQAVGIAVKGEQLFLFTRKHVVPRMERALTEVPAEIERGSSSIQSDCEKPQAATAFPGLRPACNLHFPAARPAKELPLSTLSRGGD